MNAATAGRLARRLARWYAARRVAGSLEGLFVHGLPQLRAQLAAGPVLIAANHVAWWDGLLALGLGHTLGAEVRLVARQSTLLDYPWMRHAGVMSLRTGPALRRTLGEASEFLDRPGRMLWYFPQGRQRPEGVRPLGLKRGIELFARASGLAPTPVALGYPFREDPRPAAALVIGSAGDAIGESLEAGLERIQGWADKGDPGFSRVLGRERAAEQDGIRSRLLARVLA